jgi:hypothetical protein
MLAARYGRMSVEPPRIRKPLESLINTPIWKVHENHASPIALHGIRATMSARQRYFLVGHRECGFES